jgi:uncharacterized membrane protein YvbJ
MNCPNCGLTNPDGAKFCANCGTSFGSAALAQPNAYQTQSQYQGSSSPYQAGGPYQSPAPMRGGSTVGKNIAIGCLIALLIFLFFSLSCTRACLRMGHRRAYIHRRY